MIKFGLVSLFLLFISANTIFCSQSHTALRSTVSFGNETAPDVAAIMSVPTPSFKDFSAGDLKREQAITFAATSPNETAATWNCTFSPIQTWGDLDNGGIGVIITNGDIEWRAFFVYHNLCDYIPYKYIWISPNATRFVSLPAPFQGRIVRGDDKWNLGGVARPLGTWFEFAFDDQGWIWGDVSLIRGCDGAALMWATDGSGAWKGFTQWILDGAPSGAYDTKPSGAVVLKATEDWNGSTNQVPRDWEMLKVGSDYVYVDDGHGNPVITSTNGRFATFWSAGKI